MDENELLFNGVFFVVDEEPYCLWHPGDIASLNRGFIKNFDTSYFTFLTNSIVQSNTDENDQVTAMALRSTYLQCLETFFAILGATVQAPGCVIGWMSKYQPFQLRSLIKKIHERRTILSDPKFFKKGALPWNDISTILLSDLNIDDREEYAKAINDFGIFCERFAVDFLDETNTKEYNSIKHGLRFRPGGFEVAIGTVTEMIPLGKSEFGSSFWAPEKIVDQTGYKHHIRMEEVMKNWSPVDVYHRLQFLPVMIEVVVAFLKKVNGVNPREIVVKWPKNTEDLKRNWLQERATHVTNITMVTGQPDVARIKAQKLSKEDILKYYRKPE